MRGLHLYIPGFGRIRRFTPCIYPGLGEYGRFTPCIYPGMGEWEVYTLYIPGWYTSLYTPASLFVGGYPSLLHPFHCWLREREACYTSVLHSLGEREA